MSYLAGSVSTLTGAKASRFQAVCDRLVSDVTVFENADPKKGPIGKAGAIMVAGIDITEKYKEAKACKGKDGNVAEKSAYVECVGTAVNGIVGPLSKALGGDSGNMKKIIGGISKIDNTMVKVGDVGVELSGDYYKLDNILKSVERDHSTKNLEAQAKALGAALAQTVTDVTLGHVDGQAMWQGVCRKLQEDIKIITSPKTKSGKVNVFGVALDVGAVLVEASIALKHKDYPKIGSLLQKIFSAVGLKLESETAACKNAMNGVEVTVAGIPITLHGKGPLLGNQLFQGYENIKHAFVDVLRIPTQEHVRWCVSNITHMLSEDVKNHVFTPDTPPAALWDGLLQTLENATFMELSNDGKTVQRLVLAGEDEVDLLAELKAFGAKLFNGDLKVKDVLNGLGLGLPAKYQFSSVYVPLARRNLRTGKGDRRRAFLFHHHHHHAPPPKINCEGKWGKWSTCSASCGTHGTRVRKFIVSKSPQNGGTVCPKTTTEACNRFVCPKPATSASLLKGLITKAGAAMTSQSKFLHEVMEALNKGTSSSKFKLNVLTVPKTLETDPANTVLAAAAFRSLALSMETAFELSRLSDTKANMSYNETTYLVYEFTADFADALDKLSEFAPSSQHGLWAEVASSMELATVAHPEKNALGLKLLTAASKKDLMPYIMSAGRHWRAHKYKELGSDITAIFVEAYEQTGVSNAAVHQIMKGIGSGLPESASGLYNEFGFAFKHLSSRDYPGVEHDPSLPEVVIPDVETHGVMRLASAMNETVYTTASVPTKLNQQISKVALALRHAELTQDKQGRLVRVLVTTFNNRKLDVIQQLTHAWTAWEAKDYPSVGNWLSVMIQTMINL